MNHVRVYQLPLKASNWSSKKVKSIFLNILKQGNMMFDVRLWTNFFYVYVAFTLVNAFICNQFACNPYWVMRVVEVNPVHIIFFFLPISALIALRWMITALFSYLGKKINNSVAQTLSYCWLRGGKAMNKIKNGKYLSLKRSFFASNLGSMFRFPPCDDTFIDQW